MRLREEPQRNDLFGGSRADLGRGMRGLVLAGQ